ncbi:MAG: 3TM-type holin [bacterium]
MSSEESAALPSNDWISAKWRPMMGWMYMTVCVCDFIIFPIAWNIGQAYLHVPITEWSPITLVSGGLFHMAMGAILGVAAWSRGQEKITAMNAGYVNPAPTGYSTVGYNTAPMGGMMQQETTYDSQTPVNQPAPKFGSSKVPQATQPPLD